MRKLIKQNPIEKVLVKGLPDLSGPLFFFGEIGSGKSTTMVSITQYYHDAPDKKYKVFDMYGGERNEHLYWSIPSEQSRYDKISVKKCCLDKTRIKNYQVHYLYPFYNSKFKKKLPQYYPRVISSIFTIPIHKIELEDISLVIGNLSNQDTSLWRELMSEMRKKDGPAKLLYLAKKKGKKNQSLVRDFIIPLCENKLLQSNNAATNFDIVEEMKDRETISVLCLDFIPKEFQLFIIGWISRQINYALDTGNKLKPKNIILMRETAEFFRATENSVLPDRYKIFRLQVSQFLRMSRRGVYYFMDAQSPNETKNIVEGISIMTLFGRLTGESDKESALVQL